MLNRRFFRVFMSFLVDLVIGCVDFNFRDILMSQSVTKDKGKHNGENGPQNTGNVHLRVIFKKRERNVFS
jgi:hypothetical protein